MYLSYGHMLGSHAPELWSHAPKLWSHAPVLGSHAPELWSHAPDSARTAPDSARTKQALVQCNRHTDNYTPGSLVRLCTNPSGTMLLCLPLLQDCVQITGHPGVAGFESNITIFLRQCEVSSNARVFGHSSLGEENG